jgi:hypothetical protein
MPIKPFFVSYLAQILLNALIGATIIFMCWNWAILSITEESTPHLSYRQCIGIYFLIGVTRGDYRSLMSSDTETDVK